MNLSEIKDALSKATNGEEWTNFDDREDSKTVYVYNRLTECTCDIIAECATVEMAELIANAPEWIASLVSQVEEMQKALEWYSDKNRYESKPTDADFTEWDAPDVNEDGGERARLTLQSLKGVDKHE